MAEYEKVSLNVKFVVREGVERGIRHGLVTAQKHTNTPTRIMIETEIAQAVMLELSKVIDFEE